MNHIRIHLPEVSLISVTGEECSDHLRLRQLICFFFFLQLFPSLNKVVFLDDDIVIQTDLLPLWDIDMDGKVNGAVETCRGEESCQRSSRVILISQIQSLQETLTQRNVLGLME